MVRSKQWKRHLLSLTTTHCASTEMNFHGRGGVAEVIWRGKKRRWGCLAQSALFLTPQLQLSRWFLALLEIHHQALTPSWLLHDNFNVFSFWFWTSFSIWAIQLQGNTRSFRDFIWDVPCNFYTSFCPEKGLMFPQKLFRSSSFLQSIWNSKFLSSLEG